ncbi:MAG TPA: amino acid adenylation domain-containing protein [Mycobacterium sp.]|uniref:non-ribosomal peptide synthetase family protein n=1 Tax=Mycobacterium sp. TaxID=1785 RepID=UPI002BC13086|nr:amino acid adenylation domain-containing protein [Mycobacterium sp.]HXO81662.1 amino acid adenylation domain-containing protein [Mycobacterium sp.]
MFTHGLTLPGLLRSQSLLHAESIAVSHNDQQLTFAQLADKSEQLAVHLQSLGAEADDCIGIFMDPSIDLMVGVWGVLFAGAAYLPLSPEYPDERLRHMIADSGTKVVLADQALRARLTTLAPAETIIADLADARDYRGADLSDKASPDNVAYLIYTSGSTGKPKGVMIEHRSIVNQLQWLASTHGLDERTTILQKTPLSFDAAQWEILAPACGSRVVMSGPGAYRDPEQLLDLIVNHDVTVLQGVPTLLQALVDTEELRRCTSLTRIFSGGEVLPKKLAAQLLDTLPGCALINLYGPSECTINASSFVVERDSTLAGAPSIPIGAPAHGVTFYIFDDKGAPTAVGEAGELHIGGVQVARGYVQRPDLTAERFVRNPLASEAGQDRLYRTGDLARWNADGTVEFVGRRDNQVKLRGYRVELDEVRAAVELHEWVKRAEVIVRDDPRTGANLVVFTEVDAKEAAVMDQGNHGVHHQSKSSKLQVKAQLSNAGCCQDATLADCRRIDLPGRIPTAEQRRIVFGRKTYRFFEGGDVTQADLLKLLDKQPPISDARSIDSLTLDELGGILRYFGQFHSDERLLPKYGYASPGALYATQLYLEISGIAGLASGIYYYHPIQHQLALVAPAATDGACLRLHFVGRRNAIEPVYRNNIQEVLQIEVGHMLGLFDAVLPAFGLAVGGFDSESAPANLGAPDDFRLGSCDIVPMAGPDAADPVEVYVQAHEGRISDLPAGQWRYSAGSLERVSGELVQKRHVIAINQQTYERAAFGITMLSHSPSVWTRYVDLGRKLQQLQMNDLGLGFMSSGYSSESGNDLPSARRVADIFGAGDGSAFYFVVGGRVSATQWSSEGMAEDAVHMKGPAELIRDDLAQRLPHYMVPNRVTVIDTMPLTANGKVDVKALQALDESMTKLCTGPIEEPRTETEKVIARLWRATMHRDDVSIRDDFFAAGGNSLSAVVLINKINRQLGTALPLQVLFEAPTISELAARVDRDGGAGCSRLVPLRGDGEGAPVYCWPGLGGYPMNLRLLAANAPADRPVFGIQASGINAGETICPSLAEMAALDVEMIKKHQPEGPYTLWGYSFGARLAFEVAYQLEQLGDEVEHVFLMAPGMPSLPFPGRVAADAESSFDDRLFVAVLFSVFAGSLAHPALSACLDAATDEDAFVAFIAEHFDHLDGDLVRRITGVVRETFHFPVTLDQRRISAPITVFTAQGDEVSPLENLDGVSSSPRTVVRLAADHYSLLRAAGIDELAEAIQARLRVPAEDLHQTNVRHFPIPLGGQRRTQTSHVRVSHVPVLKAARDDNHTDATGIPLWPAS